MIDPHFQYRLHATWPEAPAERSAASPAASPSGAAAASPNGTAAQGASPPADTGDPLLILVADKDTAVVADATGVRFPSVATISDGPIKEIVDSCDACHEIAVWRGRPVYALAADSEDLGRVDGTGDLKRENFRSLYLNLGDVELGLLGRAIQIVDWYATSRYCSACGSPAAVPEHEAVARCPACGHDQYPRLAPAMIVAVVRDGKLLLARAPRFKGAFHSVLAGFVEPGETAEECVHREVYEETKVRVRNVRYFGSQSWPFPHSFMLGFTAEWESGEIEIDVEELEHADWYGATELPPVPGELSISGRLINWFRERCG